MATLRKSAPKNTPAPTVSSKPIAAEKAAPAIADKSSALVNDAADGVLAHVREAQESFRKSTEDSMARSHETYERLKTNAEAAAGSIETSFAAARSGLQSLNSQAFDAVKQQAQAGFEHASALLAAKDIKDIFTLQGEFIRKQFEVLTSQAKEISSHLQKIATESSAPLKAAVSGH